MLKLNSQQLFTKSKYTPSLMVQPPLTFNQNEDIATFSSMRKPSYQTEYGESTENPNETEQESSGIVL